MQSNLQSIYRAKKAYKAEIVKLENEKSTYAAEYRMKEAQERWKVFINAVARDRGSIMNSLDNMLESAMSRRDLIDFEDLRLLNALKAIEVVGDSLSVESINKIVSQFNGDQANLQLLQEALTRAGTVHMDVINSMIYNPVMEFHQVATSVYGILDPNNLGSINEAAREIAKLAKFEGFTFNTEIDPDGTVNAMRKAAGLAVD